MKKKPIRWQTSTVTLSLATFAIVSSFWLSACQKNTQVIGDEDIDLGNPKASVTLVEYASATCGHCAAFDREVFRTLKTRYIDTGRIHYVFKEMLTPPAPVAAASFVLARCAGKDKYIPFIETVFQSQDELFSNTNPRGPLLRIAKSMGMTEQQFDNCLSNQAALDGVSKRAERSMNQDKINGTPTLVLNGQKLEGDEVLLDKLSRRIDNLLSQKENKPK